MDHDKEEKKESWQAKIKKNKCCMFSERVLKRMYKLNGGTSSATGEGSMDGCPTTLAAHNLAEIGQAYNAWGKSCTDLGCSTCLTAIHLAMAVPDLMFLCIECNEHRYKAAINNLINIPAELVRQCSNYRIFLPLNSYLI